MQNQKENPYTNIRSYNMKRIYQGYKHSVYYRNNKSFCVFLFNCEIKTYVQVEKLANASKELVKYKKV